MHWRRYTSSIPCESHTAAYRAVMWPRCCVAAAFQECEASCTVSAVLLCKGLVATSQGCAAMPASQQVQQLQAEVTQSAYTWPR